MRLPPGTDIRLGMIPGQPNAFFVFVAAPPFKAGAHLLDMAARAGELTALLIHDAGVDWMDARGEALAESTLAAGGCVVMQFETMADAMAAHRRLLRESVC